MSCIGVQSLAERLSSHNGKSSEPCPIEIQGLLASASSTVEASWSATELKDSETRPGRL
jgi:hypothetical protein